MSVLLYKPFGLTPLQAIEKFRQKYTEFESCKIGYAGRLDPMAEGILLLLIDQENKEKHKYERLDKIYRFDILWGVETDTYDILGEITELTNKHPSITDVKQLVSELTGARTQKYPPYSAARVQGKPLYWWARRNKLETIAIPEKEIRIYEAKYLKSNTISTHKLLEQIQPRIDSVDGDFRQEKIKVLWQRGTRDASDFLVSSAEVTCSSGTYIRSLCHEMGRATGTGAIAYGIKRITIGEYSLNSDILKISEDKKTYKKDTNYNM